MRPTPLRYPAIPLLCLLLSATACVEEETLDAPESGSLTAISNNLETPEAAATTDEPAEERADEAATEGDFRSDSEATVGQYRADFCQDEAFITTESITRDEAIENCGLNFSNNRELGIRCN